MPMEAYSGGVFVASDANTFVGIFVVGLRDDSKTVRKKSFHWRRFVSTPTDLMAT